ncbi:LamG domain-containing protein [Luedemannella helvata]|uniref:Concanavalin A-like lectin/glucanase superfamily protein n=1 Tax=Luedemannella helvata TaxID=349315 RepID=A0ABP4WJV5_9ACTN
MRGRRTVLSVAALVTVSAVPTAVAARTGVLASVVPDELLPPQVIARGLPASPSAHPVPPAPPPSAAPPVAGQWRVVARYTFDRGLGEGVVRDDSGHGHTLEVASRNGGRIVPAVRGEGLAVRYPRPCYPWMAVRVPKAAASCPRAVLQADSSEDLNPGTRPFSWGAMVQLSATATSPGENILQKGLRTRTGQFKLQVDGAAGYPSCVLTETRTARFHRAFGQRTVADGQWHRVDCVRTRNRLSIFIDGRPNDHRRIPPTLRISNSMPLRIGGKGVLRGNDQFNGAVDNVYVARG